MTGCFGDFGTARRTMVVWPSEVPRLKIVLPPGFVCWRLRWYYWWDRPRFIGCGHLRRGRRRLSFICWFILWRFIGLLLLQLLVLLVLLVLLLLLLLLFNTTWYRFNGFLYCSFQRASISAKGPFWYLDRGCPSLYYKIIGHLYSLPFFCHFW